MTCAELDALCDRAAHALHAAGVRKGTRTVLMVKPGPEFFAIAFALFKIGAISVLVDPGMGIKNLGQCLAEAEPTAFVGIPKAHVARKLFGWARQSLRINVTVGRRLFWGGHSFPALMAATPDDPFAVEDSKPDEVAAILFTSGSTGVPKGVVYTHATFASQVELLREVYAIAPGEVDLSTFPLFALFGPALGMASVVPWMDASRPASANPVDLVAAIEKFSCTSMFVSPALVNLLGRHCEAGGKRLPSLRRVISAGAPASPAALERLARALGDGVEIFTPYGATEALPVSSIGSARILGETRKRTDAGHGVCVGRPVPGVEVAIIPIVEDAIPEWNEELRLAPNEIGEIVVRGPNVTGSYFNRVESTRLAKISDGATILHRMGDVGYLDEDGRLWMCGRKSHRVRTEDRVMFTIPCEAIYNTHSAVFRSALVGVESDGATKPVICIELDPGQSASDALTSQLLALGAGAEASRGIDTLLYHPGFPVDVRHNAKIFRERLAIWAARKLG